MPSNLSLACSERRKRLNARRPVVVEALNLPTVLAQVRPVSLCSSTVSLPVSQSSAYYTQLSIFSGNRRPSILFASPASLRSLIFSCLASFTFSSFVSPCTTVSSLSSLAIMTSSHKDFRCSFFRVQRCVLRFGPRLRRLRPTSQLVPSATPSTTTDSSYPRLLVLETPRTTHPHKHSHFQNFYSTATMAKGGGASLLWPLSMTPTSPSL